MVLFGLLMLNANWVQVVKADAYRDDPRNSRVLLRTYERERGAIAVVQPDGSGRVALGGVAHKPWRVEGAEQRMKSGAKAVADVLLADARTTPENAFKVPLVQRTLQSVLTEVKKG